MSKEKLFGRFITENLDNAYRFAFIYVNDQQLAEDIVSDSVVRALKSLHRLKSEEFLKTWFYKIIANTAGIFMVFIIKPAV